VRRFIALAFVLACAAPASAGFDPPLKTAIIPVTGQAAYSARPRPITCEP
jgi:hypothetical protein